MLLPIQLVNAVQQVALRHIVPEATLGGERQYAMFRQGSEGPIQCFLAAEACIGNHGQTFFLKVEGQKRIPGPVHHLLHWMHIEIHAKVWANSLPNLQEKGKILLRVLPHPLKLVVVDEEMKEVKGGDFRHVQGHDSVEGNQLFWGGIVYGFQTGKAKRTCSRWAVENILLVFRKKSIQKEGDVRRVDSGASPFV